MLSKNDLQQIAGLLEPLREDISGLKQDVSGLKQDVSSLNTNVGSLQEDMVFVKKSLRGLKMKTTRIKNTLDVAIDMFDRNYINHEKRIKQLEENITN